MISVTDNPIILSEIEAVSGGNFHGQPLALALDFAAIALAELASISERRTYLLLEGHDGLPKLLMQDTGVNSGFMIPQYTAAALVSENKVLCHPASVDSIPTSLGQEDHVSMGTIAMRQTREILDNVEHVVAIELLCAAQGLDFHLAGEAVGVRGGHGTILGLEQALSSARALRFAPKHHDRGRSRTPAALTWNDQAPPAENLERPRSRHFGSIRRS